MLRDRVVCGIQNGRIQQKLLAESTLTLERAMQMSLTLERAEKNLRDLDPTINVFNQATRETGETCHRCGKNNHSQEECQFRNAECFSCHTDGHIAAICNKKKSINRKEEI